MQDQIICPHCHQHIPLTQALTQQIAGTYQARIDELNKLREDDKSKYTQWAKIRIEEERVKAIKETESQVRQKITDELQLQIKNTKNESEELKKQKAEMQNQVLELHKTVRALQDAGKEKELELTKRFQDEQEKFRTQEQQRAKEAVQLQLLEKEKKINDVMKMNEELKRKLEQGSQQTQGEMLELALESFLKREFPFDSIKPVPKGVSGADLVQEVYTRTGQLCGTILWETKRTKSWSNQWIGKLKADQRNVKSELAVIISEMIPEGLTHFGCIDGVWIGKFDFVSGIAYALRAQLIEIAQVRSAQQGKNGKTEELFEYITSTAFRQRIEAIVEAFTGMQGEIEKEKRWFTQKWAREEKNIRSVIDMTIGMKGELQSITGATEEEYVPTNGLLVDDTMVNNRLL